MAEPVVTVGIPVFNGSNFLEEAINSIAGQTFENIEIIVADNASTDGTEEIGRAAMAMDPRVRYHRHSENLGAPANYNFTVDRAQGEYFMWCAHDDLRAPEFVATALKLFAERPECALVYSAGVSIDEAGRRLGELPRHDDLAATAVHRRFRATIVTPHPSLVVFGLMRLATMNATGRHGSYLGADRLFSAQLALLGPFGEIAEPMFMNRTHPGRYGEIPYGRGREAAERKRLWWDPTRGQSPLLPRWHRLRAYAQAIRAYPLSASDRVKCFTALGTTLAHNRFADARVLARELWDTFPELVTMRG